MDINKILSLCDHTLLKQNATEQEIMEILDDGMKYKTASACIPPSFVKFAKDYTKGNLPICTVIGFPNGYNKTNVKVFETEQAIIDGADEIDMVINIGWVKQCKYDLILSEINEIKTACQGKLLKVIIETCLLNESEIKKMCQVVSDSQADYIKTSTGFSTAGATFDNIEIMASSCKKGLGIKAAGGIGSIEDAEKFINLGATRLGTSRVVKIVKEMK